MESLARFIQDNTVQPQKAADQRQASLSIYDQLCVVQFGEIGR